MSDQVATEHDRTQLAKDLKPLGLTLLIISSHKNSRKSFLCPFWFYFERCTSFAYMQIQLIPQQQNTTFPLQK